MLGHRCKSEEAKKLPTSDEEHIYAADTCGVANDIRLTLMQRFFKDVGVYGNITSFTPEREKLKILEALLMLWIFYVLNNNSSITNNMLSSCLFTLQYSSQKWVVTKERVRN